jgi:hypothetical protein
MLFKEKKPMKKMLLLIQLIAVAMLYSSISYADDDWDDYEHHGHGWGHHHHGHGWGNHRRHGYYPRQQINNYYPQPQVNNYYPEPPVNYYPPQPRYYGYDQRSHQGLAGGVIGSVFGYEMGGGDPLAAGIGAAAGSFFGNGFGVRY